MASIFTRIIQGDIPCYKIAEDEEFFAFLDISPLSPGHTLVVPKKEVDKYFDLESSEIAGLNVFAQRIAHAIRDVIPCQRVGQIVFGLEVPHAHIHLIPIRTEEDMSFTKRRESFSEDEMKEIAQKIRSAL